MSSIGFLQPDDYYKVIKTTTLTSIDIVPMFENRILVGLRQNSPAKGFWFVPGSRTGKGELLDIAIRRITKNEMGVEFSKERMHHLGCYDHVYRDNFRDDTFGTHYVVNSFLLPLNEEEVRMIKHDEQHSSFKWVSLDEVENDDTIHMNVKNYIPEIIKAY